MSTKAKTETEQLIGAGPLGIPDAVRDRLSDEVIDGLLAGARSEEEIVGPGGVLAQLTKRLVERALSAELTEHLGYEPHPRRDRQHAQRLDGEDARDRARPGRDRDAARP